VRPGQLRHRIAVDVPARTQSASGEIVNGWTTLTTVWGGIEPARASEAVVANQQLGDLDTKIVIRWSERVADISSAWRLRHQTTVYDIKSVANVRQENRTLEIMCKSGRNRGG
jgi:SPP1 family predicted phage head-tail adaptor